MPTGVSVGAKQGSRLHSGWLVGASVIALVALSPQVSAQEVAAASAPAPSAPASADPPPKYLPNISFSGQGGGHEGNLKLTGFDPVWQNLDSLVYVRLGIGTPTSENGFFGNFGAGYRTKITALDDQWVAGVFAGFDITSTRYKHTFAQASVGAELMNADWDARINAYLPTDTKVVDAANTFKLYLHDTRIAILQGQEAPYTGVDGEVGYRIFSTDNMDVRLFAGGFNFDRDSSAQSSGGQVFHLGHDNLSGPMGRAEVDLYNVNIFGSKSRLMFSGKVTHDNERGTQGYVGALLQVPIGANDADETTDELDRRMVDPVRRQDDVLIDFAYSKPEPVIIYNGTITSEPTNTLYYVDNHTGAGSYADPTTFHDATARGPHNQFVVLTDRDGTVNASGVVVQHGESVVGPGTFSIRGVDSHKTFTHDFAPGSGPVTVNTADGIKIHSDTNLYGFTLDSSATDAIYGLNVDDVVIGDLHINGGGTGVNGVHIVEGPGRTGTVHIVDSSIANVTGDGVVAYVRSTGTTTTTFNLDIDNLTETGIGTDGVAVSAMASFGGTTNTSVGIHDSSITAAGIGVNVSTTADAASTGTQSVVIDPTTISGGTYGIRIGALSYGGTVTQSVSIADTTISNESYAGALVYGAAFEGGTVNQTVTINNLTVHGGGTTYYPLYIQAVGVGGTVTQHTTGNHISVDAGYYDNITVESYAAYGGTVHQYATLTDVTTTGSVFGDGLFIHDEVYEGATGTQHVSVDHLTATGNYFDGVGISATADNYTPGNSAVAAQYVTLNHTTATGNGFDGVFAVADGFDASISRQDVTVANSTLDYNGQYGFGTVVDAGFEGSVQQYVNLLGDDVSHNSLGGASVTAEAIFLGSVQQNVYIDGSTFDDNGGDGIFIGADAFAAGQISQSAGIYNTIATGNTGDGLDIVSDTYGYAIGYAPYYSHTAQNVIAAYDNFSLNARNGVEVSNYTGYGAQLNQFVYLFGDNMSGNGPSSGPLPAGAGNGVYVHSVNQAYGFYGGAITTNTYSDIYVVDSAANLNANDGIRFMGTTYGPSYTIQHLVVEATNGMQNGHNGLSSYAAAYGFYSLNIQYLTVAGSHFNLNGHDGAAFEATQAYGPLSFGAAIQDVSINNSSFNSNTRDGLYAVANAYDFQGRAEQHFTINGSYFSGNGRDGATFAATAHDGVYQPGYNCGNIQGLVGGCAFVRQTVQIVGSQLDSNGANGILVYNTADNYGAVYNSSGRPSATPTLVVAYSDVSHNGLDGVHIVNNASNNSYIYSYFVGLGSTFDLNRHNGIEVDSDAETGSAVLQKTILYGIPGSVVSSASYNDGDGILVNSTATGGTVQQLVGVYGSYLAGNGDSGVKVVGKTYEPTVAGSPGYVADPTVSVVSQYINAIGNEFATNGVGAAPGSYEGGLLAGAFAYGPHATSQQYVTAIGNVFFANYVGMGVGSFAYFGGAVNQYVDSEHNLFTENSAGEILIARGSYTGSATQTLYDAYNTMTYNGLGFGAVANAQSGGTVLQNLGLYDDNISHNVFAGASIRSNAAGYAFGYVIYYSHVSQNVIAGGDMFDYNQGNGLQVSNNAFYGGALNQFIYVFNSEANRNGVAGFYEDSVTTSYRGNDFAFNTNQSTSLYLINSTFNLNGANGIDIRSYNNGPNYTPSFFGGYSYQIQHTIISGTTANGNAGSGLNVVTQAHGEYGFGANYVTISGGAFDFNQGSGAKFTSTDYFGPGSFGASFQQITINGADFSHNGADGIDLMAVATGRQGRAEQHTTITGSTMDGNAGDGVSIYASAHDGVYIAGHPCDTIQGLPGGCAFVRQNTVIVGSMMNGNGNNGVNVITYANNYGAVYGASGRPHSPTLELYGDTIRNNNSRGVDVSNHVSSNSYLYQYNAFIDTNIDHNGSDGVYMSSYVGGGSVMLQRDLLYSYHTGASAEYNAGSGMKTVIEALGGSYARDVNIVEGAELSGNGGWGVDNAVAYADASSTGLAINAIYFNNVNHNGDGIGFYSIGPGAQQISYVDFNNVTHNAFVGIYGEANFGSFQYIQVYTGNNYVHSNGTNYLFNSFGGSTQILN